jgi:gliding motility-associated-like protein
VPLGAFIPAGSKMGDATPDLNNVSFSISGSALSIMQSQTGIHSSYYVQYLSPYNNSLNLLDPQVKALLHGTGTSNTDLLVPIPVGADVIFLSGKGTNSSYADLNTSDGTEEGYSNLRFTIDLNSGLTNGFVTLANGGSANRRSTYVVRNMSSTYSGQLVGSGAADGDYNGKSANQGAVGIYNPRIYVSGSHLVIKRDASYARDFDDAYIVEFYERTGQGMSAEFVNSDIKTIPKGQSSHTGVTRTFTIPPGTNAIYFNETGNAVNVTRESNENSVEAYAYIDLTTETASGYFYQQVGLSQEQRRDDNYAFRGVPLDNSSTRSHANTVGFKGPYYYDLSFSLSADKSQLTVTNKTGLANPDYQILLSADYYGSKPDIAFNSSGLTFTKVSSHVVKANVAVCNPGSGNSNGGMPVAFYHGDPTVNPAAKLLYTGTFPEDIEAGECKNFSFDIDLTGFSNLNIDLTIVINDDGSFVSGGVGHTVGTPFTLAALATQHTTYQECYYGNNLITKSISVNNAPTGAGDSKTTPENTPVSGAVTGNDPDGDVLAFTKASDPAHGAVVVNADGTYTYTPQANYNGPDNFMVKISDDKNEEITVTVNIVVTPVNEVPTGTGDTKTTPEDTPVSGAVTGTDGDADQLTFAKGSDPAHGTVVVNSDGSYTYTPAAKYNGADNFTITIADGNGGTATVAVDITVTPVNEAPTGTGDAKTTPENTAVSGAVTGADGDGDQLTFSKASDPAHGAVVVNSDGTYTYTPNNKYNGPDNFTITINDGNGGTATVAVDITVTPVNEAPAGTGDSKTTPENTAVSGAVTGADGDGDQLTFSKATDPAHGTAVVNNDGTYTYTPNSKYNGPDNFTITINDGNGGTTTVAVDITVTPVNEAPAGTGDAKTTPENTAVSGAVSGTDGDGDQLTFGKASDPAHGAVVVNGDGTYTYTPNNKYNGPDNFTITINDENGGTTTVAVDITVTPVNEAPTGTGDSKTTPENTAVSGAVTGADGDGDQLTFSKASDPAHGTTVVNNNGTYTYTPNNKYNGPDNFTITIADGNGGTTTVTVDITVTPVNDAPTGTGDSKTTPEDIVVSGAVTGMDGDGDQLTFAKATDPAHGAAIVNSDGTYTYTPNNKYNGPDNFTIAISDGNGGTVTVIVDITVTPVNEAPTGTGDSKTTPENTAVSGVVTGTDGDGDQLTFSKDSDPAHGTVVVNSDGTYTYTPNNKYNGPDNFTINIADGNGGSTTVNVDITVTPVNEAPTGTGDSKTTPENTAVSGAVTGADGDGDQLTFNKATDPAHGTVVVNSDGTYAYTPNNKYNGPDNFTITINDGNGSTATVAVDITVTPVNEAPAGTGDSKTTPENTAVSGAVTGADGDGDQLTFSKATDPAHGTAVVNNDGTYTYTPNNKYNGPDNFTIAISDGNGGTVTVIVDITVTPVNEAPTGTGDSKTTPENTAVSGAVTGTDGDGDQLTFSKTTDPAHGTAVVNNDGTYTYTPGNKYNGPDNFTITINDGNGGTTTVTVDITVTPINEAPTGTGDSKITPENTTVSGAVTGADGDGDQLTFSKASDPAHGTTVVNNDGTYTYTPNNKYNGPDNFTITIADGNGGTTTVTVDITVTPVNEAPTGTGDSKTTPENTAVSGAVTGMDGDGDLLTFTKTTDPGHGTVIVNNDGTYTYTPNNKYYGPDNFTIAINDGNGGTVKVTVSITVTPVNEAPTGTGDSKTTPENTAISGAVTGADGDGDQLTFAKATNSAHGTAFVNVDGTYTYTPNNKYNGPDNFTITIADGNGGTTTVTVDITVTPVNEAPTGIGDSKTTPENTAVSGAVSGTDGDGDQLTFGKASDPAHGAVVVNSDGTYTYTPSNKYNGPDNFTIAINDGNGGTVTVTIDITVTPVNEAPTGTGDSKTTPENTAVSGAVTGADGDGDQLTFSKVTDPAHGTVVVNGDGTYTYTPNNKYNGPDNFTITINDVSGGSTMVAVDITVTPVNEPPTGNDDSKTIQENTSVSGAVTGADGDGDVLTFTKVTDPAHGTATVAADGTYTYTPEANYSGPDYFTIDISDGNGGSVIVKVIVTVTPVNDVPTGTGDTKTTPENTAVNGTVNGADGDGDRLTFSKAADPAHGTVTVNGDGTYTYMPNNKYNGPDNFTINIADGNGGSITVNVDITVIPVNEAPTGTGDSKTTPENTAVSGTVTGTDGDGDQLTFAKATDPAHGTVTVNSDGTYTYTPNNKYNGPDNFTISIADGNGGSSTVTVDITITPVNEPPTGNDDSKTTPENTSVSGALKGVDGDGDVLTFTKVTNPAHGTAVVAADGAYTYTPAANYNGPDYFTIDISDGNGASVIVKVVVTVTPVNEAPTGTGDSKTTPENTAVSGAVTGADGDGDQLTFVKVSDPAHGTARIAGDGTYTYTPNNKYNGPDNFTISIADGNGGSTTVAVVIVVTPANEAPTGTGDAKTTPENTAVSGTVTGADGDGDQLTFAKATDPAHGSVTVNSDGTYTYTPNNKYNGPDNFTITISDGNGGTTTVIVNITVTPVNAPPSGSGDTRTTNENTPVTGAVTGTDADGDQLTFTQATNPAHGTTTVNSDGSYIYTPAANYTGPDNFTVTISDGNGGATIVPVNITVIPLNLSAGIALVKTGILRSDYISITYAFTVTNTGQATLYNVTITDPKLGLNKTLPAELQPGASANITAVYTITPADRKTGIVTNTATAKGETIKHIEVTDISGTATGNDQPTKTRVPRSPEAFDDEADTKANTAVTVAVLINDNPAHSSFNTASLTIMRQPMHGKVLTNSDGTVTYIPDNSFGGDDNFSYQVQDKDGYPTNVAKVVLHVLPGDLKIPTLFTPNGDGKNDVFEIRGLQQYAENELVVINRWGNEVYRQKNYQNNWRGDGLNEGTYYYLLRIRKTNGSNWEVLKGYTTLIRAFKQ